MDYDPATGDAKIIGVDGNRDQTFPDHKAAISSAMKEINRGGTPTISEQIDDLADLIATLEADPTHYSNVTRTRPSSPNPPTPDGEPDGGLNSYGSSGSTMPITSFRSASFLGVAIYGVLAFLYAGCVAAVIIRRRRMRALAMA